MSGDTLSDLLRAVRLRGAMFYSVEGAERWVAETPRGEEILPGLLPGVEHLMGFHGVARGSCWAAVAGEEPIRLDEGDVVLFLQGDPHVISSAPGMRARHVERSTYFAPRPEQLPFMLRVSERGECSPADAETDPGHARLVCGFLGCDLRPFNPLISSLPRMLRVSGLASGSRSWVGTLLEWVVDESNRKRPGGEAVLERMSEMMFVEALRRYVDELPPGQTGWLAGLRDPAIGRALALIHRSPGEAWTLERLGESAGVSRSVLHERFVLLLGQPPMQYLTEWRMQVASGWLRDTDAKVLEIALAVGYENEPAFSRAFRRSVGQPPGAWRRARRTRLSGRPSD